MTPRSYGSAAAALQSKQCSIITYRGNVSMCLLMHIYEHALSEREKCNHASIIPPTNLQGTIVYARLGVSP